MALLRHEAKSPEIEGSLPSEYLMDTHVGFALNILPCMQKPSMNGGFIQLKMCLDVVRLDN